MANVIYTVPLALNADSSNLANTANALNANSLTNVVIGGGTNGYFLQTDGTGNLSWAAGTANGNGIIGGSNTQVQYNNAGNFAGSSTFTFDNTTNTVSIANLTVTTKANLGNSGNVIITGGSANYFLKTDGNGNLSWAAGGGTGTVTNVATSGSGLGFTLTGGPITTTGTVTLTVPNATSLRTSLNIGNVANLSLNGNGTTYLAGNGSFTVPAGTYSNSNVANYLPNYTGNIQAGNLQVNNNANVTANIRANNVTVNTLLTTSTANATVFNGVTGNFQGTVYANILSVYTANVTANLTTGNANLGNLAIANYFSGDGGLITNVTSNFAYYAGNVTANNQPNITSVGTLGNLTVSGNITSNNISIGNVIAGNNATLTGNITANNANITNSLSVGTTANITGNLTSGNANLGNAAIANYFIGSGANLTNLNASNISGTVANANYAAYAGNVTIASQSNITSLGNLTGLIVSGNANIEGTLSIYEGIENVALISPQSGTYNFDLLDGSIQYASANAANNVTLNFRGNSSVNTNTLLSNGKSITATYLMTLGNTTAYVSGVQVDGVATTVSYAGGVSSIGLANSVVSYTYTIIKTNNATYTVLGSVTRYV
jgi:cytoskeletal protein CcmA (bactofilin family)